MKTSVRDAWRLAWRFILIWLIETGVIILLSMRFYGVTLETPLSSKMIVSAAVLALVLSTANSLISPAIILLRIPLNILTLGICAIFANSALLYLAATHMPGLDIQPFLPTAVLAALLMAIINSILTALIALDEYTYFQFALHVFSGDRNLRRALLKPQGSPGIIIIQIDGLAPSYLDQALRKGYVPFLSRIQQDNSHYIGALRLRPAIADLSCSGWHHVWR